MLHDPRRDLPEWRSILLCAREIIEECGWCQYALQAEDGSVCLEGAVVIASGVKVFRSRKGHYEYAADDPCLRAASRPIAILELQVVGKRLSRWNDERGRTKEEVLRLLRDTADGISYAHESRWRPENMAALRSLFEARLRDLKRVNA